MDIAFRVFQKKEIYEFLQGDGDQELVQYNGKWYGLPYHRASDLGSICRSFGYTEDLSGSRWTYLESLFQYAIETNRCSELFTFLFSLEQFYNLEDLPSMDEIESIHQKIINAAIDRLNYMIRLTRKELQLIDGNFYVVDAGKYPELQTPKLNRISSAYVRDLRQRCEDDLKNGNYDSVIAKSRTLIEETLIYYLEQNGETVTGKGDLIKLYGQVKNLRKMTQNSEYDKSINELLSGLEKIVNSIATMRNINSDAHGVGNKRIRIKEKEARLVMNAAMSYCEYMLL